MDERGQRRTRTRHNCGAAREERSVGFYLAGHAAIAQSPMRPIEDDPGARRGAQDEDLQGPEGEKDKNGDAMDEEDEQDGEDGA